MHGPNFVRALYVQTSLSFDIFRSLMNGILFCLEDGHRL